MTGSWGKENWMDSKIHGRISFHIYGKNSWKISIFSSICAVGSLPFSKELAQGILKKEILIHIQWTSTNWIIRVFYECIVKLFLPKFWKYRCTASQSYVWKTAHCCFDNFMYLFTALIILGSRLNVTLAITCNVR